MLETPVLVPAFPRENYTGQEDYVYPRFLDRGAVQKRTDVRSRIDLQLVTMIKNARQVLAHNGITVAEKVFIMGYSSDGKFAQRFTILHPEMAAAVAAGGIAGACTLPLSEYNGENCDIR